MDVSIYSSHKRQVAPCFYSAHISLKQAEVGLSLRRWREKRTEENFTCDSRPWNDSVVHQDILGINLVLGYAFTFSHMVVRLFLQEIIYLTEG